MSSVPPAAGRHTMWRNVLLVTACAIVWAGCAETVEPTPGLGSTVVEAPIPTPAPTGEGQPPPPSTPEPTETARPRAALSSAPTRPQISASTVVALAEPGTVAIERVTGSGSGVVFHESGYIVTTAQVVSGATRVTARRGYVNRCVNDIRRRPSQPLAQRRFHPRIECRDRRLRSTQGPSDA